MPVPKWGSGFWGRVQGDAFLVDSGKDSFRFYEGIVPLSRWEKLSLFLARVCFTMCRERKRERE